MHKIDGTGHVNNRFSSENADNYCPPTVITEDWLNAVQDELINVITKAGLEPSKKNNNQISEALDKLTIQYIPNMNVLRSISSTQTRCIYLMGYYETNDGGQGLFHWDENATNTDDGGLVICPSSHHTPGRWIRFIDGNFYSVRWFGARAAYPDHDDTSALNAAHSAAAMGVVFYPNGHYLVTDKISISPHQKIIGQTREGTIINSTSDAPIFFCQSPVLNSNYDIEASLEISSLKLSGKNLIQINTESDTENIFPRQAAIKGAIFRNLTLEGRYDKSKEKLSESATYPTTSELNNSGTGLKAAKLFDAHIQSCRIYNCGIGIYFIGCDINTIDTNRFDSNARHYHGKPVGTYGYQNKIKNNEFLRNFRRGAIYDSSSFTTIEDNYFETYSPAAEYITIRGGWSSIISLNRFDNSGVATTPLLSLAPMYGLIVSQNRVNPSLPSAPIEVLYDNYSPKTSGLANHSLIKFVDNATSFPTPSSPMCEYTINNQRLFDAFNPKPMGGMQSLSFPWKTSTATGKWVLKTDIQSIIFSLLTLPSDRNLKVNFVGRYISGGGYVKLKWGGIAVFSGYLGFSKSDAIQTKSITVRKPDVIPSESEISVELVNTQVEYQSVDIYPVDYQLLDTLPTTGNWEIGDRIIKKTPGIGQPKGWTCITSGVPGVWASEGNL